MSASGCYDHREPLDDPIRVTTTLLPVTGGRSITVEVFEPPDAMVHPAVIVLHGADGPLRKAEQYRETCRALAACGFVALRPHYFEAGESAAAGNEQLGNPLSHAAWLQAVNATADYAHKLPSVMDNRVGIVGFSLGGYLALAAAVLHERYAAVVEFYGGMPEVIAGLVQHLPPTLAIHGEQDDVVPVAEARKLEQMYRDRGLNCELQVYPGEGHHFSNDNMYDALQKTRSFLHRHLDRNGNGV